MNAHRLFVAGVVLGSLFFSVPGLHAVTWNEAVDGDLSNTPGSPTNLGVFAIGSHTVTMTSAFGDQDDFTFSVPADAQLSAMINSFYDSGSLDDVSFVSINAGSTIPNQGMAPGNLLGYAHFGPGTTVIGADLLPVMAVSDDAIGFTPPLGAGSYSIWSQQAGPSSTYTFVFDVTAVPEPASLGALSLAVIALQRRRATS